MWTYAKTREALNKVLSWNDFDQVEPQLSSESFTLQIASYLRHLLEKYEESEFVKYLIAPSPSALSGYFRCDEEEITKALHELKRQGYEFESSGSTHPIVLWDPLVRRASEHPDNDLHWTQAFGSKAG